MAEREVLPAAVVGARQVSEHLRSVTVGGPALRTFPYVGADQALRLFLPRPGQGRLRLPGPDPDGWLAAFRAIPEADRPRARIYTVRSHDPVAGEIEIEFVVHGTSAPASRWALECRPGDRLGILPERARYQPGDRGGRHLLVAEESGLPAALGVLDVATEADALLEVPAVGDVRALDLPAGLAVTWLPRADPQARPGALALQTLRSMPVPDPLPTYAWLVGERTLATEGRRHLVREWGMAASDVEFVGYWRHGEASAG